MKKKIIIISIVIIIFVFIFIIKKDNLNKFTLSNEEINMVEKYLNNKYGIELKLNNYDYSNYSEGFNGGINYIFYFEKIDNLSFRATLRYLELNEDNLESIILNITDIDKAKEFEKFLEKNSNYEWEIETFRLENNADNDSYFFYEVEMIDESDDSQYRLYGDINENESYENISMSLVGISGNFIDNYEEDIDNLYLKDWLELVKKYH